VARRRNSLTKDGQGERVLLEATPKPARDVSPVMGYFSWGRPTRRIACGR
jgi:hypothetical protein